MKTLHETGLCGLRHLVSLPHIFIDLKYSGVFGVGHPSLPVVQLIGLQYSILVYPVIGTCMLYRDMLGCRGGHVHDPKSRLIGYAVPMVMIRKRENEKNIYCVLYNATLQTKT